MLFSKGYENRPTLELTLDISMVLKLFPCTQWHLNQCLDDCIGPSMIQSVSTKLE